jgi:hypothetical protein
VPPTVTRKLSVSLCVFVRRFFCVDYVLLSETGRRAPSKLATSKFWEFGSAAHGHVATVQLRVEHQWVPPHGSCVAYMTTCAELGAQWHHCWLYHAFQAHWEQRRWLLIHVTAPGSLPQNAASAASAAGYHVSTPAAALLARRSNLQVELGELASVAGYCSGYSRCLSSGLVSIRLCWCRFSQCLAAAVQRAELQWAGRRHFGLLRGVAAHASLTPGMGTTYVSSAILRHVSPYPASVRRWPHSQ